MTLAECLQFKLIKKIILQIGKVCVSIKVKLELIFIGEEFRKFALTFGPHILKGIVEDKYYNNYALLVEEVKKLLQPIPENELLQTSKKLNLFVDEYEVGRP